MSWQGEVTVVRDSEKALLVRYEDEEFWVPKSQIHDDSEIYSGKQVGETGMLVLPDWLAKAKGWLNDLRGIHEEAPRGAAELRGVLAQGARESSRPVSNEDGRGPMGYQFLAWSGF